MELWIRSQDKMKLVKVNYFYIMDQQDHFTIIGETIDSGPIIATYKTKERALEVLDEIENKLKSEDNDLINKLKILENTPIINCSNNDECEINVNIELLKNMIIYEMPED